ncbi:pyruvate dehydrogenase phosphatase regulatory subunit-like protein [Leptotrombidium deliense]|uniref:Pyruvate dehydrogenase phosphatase regulatory subunit-like protein n=1 Tax=Leptotrombidium deliense TaxID=299467 RepID=A0A443SAK4_9ACAR|nr:pyruvate dehydrogenase phosphatase regulatory subunit-like protein [Leptotrombidium deliense]
MKNICFSAIIDRRHRIITRMIRRSYCISGRPPIEERVVIFGGGFVGTSVAYHISNVWPKSCIVLDAFPKGSDYGHISKVQNSTTVNHFKPNTLEAKLVLYTSKLLNIKPCGSLFLASNKERVASFQRIIGCLKMLPNISNYEILSPQEIKSKYEWINMDSIEAGVWVPEGGVIQDLREAKKRLRDESEKNGVMFYYGWHVKRVLTVARRVIGVEITNIATGQTVSIGCEHFVNAGGYISRSVGKLVIPEVKIPVLNVQHQILETKADRELSSQINCIVHDCDKRLHIYKQSNDTFMITGHPVVSKPISQEPNTVRSGQFRLGLDPAVLNPDWDAFHPILNDAINRFNGLKNLKLSNLYNVPKTYSPDGRPVVGESPDIENFYIATGVDYEMSGGIGKLVADQITKNEKDPICRDFWSIDCRRFVSQQSSHSFLMDRLREIPGHSCYSMGFASHFGDFFTGHPLRTIPLYSRFNEKGAKFVQIMGYERPAVYASPSENSSNFSGEQKVRRHNILQHKTLGKPEWFEVVREEYEACRTRVAICDYSSFSKMEIFSPDESVVNFLQYLCSNDVDLDVGHIVHTGLQNESGGYENDCSLVRLANNHFMLIGPTEQQKRCLSWILRHLKDNVIQVQDVTNKYTALCLMGPLSKLLLTDIVDEPHVMEKFPFFTYKSLSVGDARLLRVCNITHTGELGWVLYIPNDYALHVYDRIVSAGSKYAIRHIGSITMRSLRIEKFYAFWGQDLDTSTTPLECGRAFRVRFDKNFIGREALLRQKEKGIKRRYVQLILENFDESCPVWPNGMEPIFVSGHDEPIGMTTTTGYGYTLGKHVCLGFVHHPNRDIAIDNEYVLKSSFSVEISGQKWPAKVNIHSPKLASFGEGYLATR